MASILNSIKKPLGLAEDYTAYDEELIIHINGVFLTLCELGVGPSEGFAISTQNDDCDDFKTPEDTNLMEWLPSYMYLRVRLVFDPPTSAFTTESFQNRIKEYEWRLNVQAETPAKGGE